VRFKRTLPIICLAIGIIAGCSTDKSTKKSESIASKEIKTVVESAIEQIAITKSYDPAYTPIEYPGGDVSLRTGVCTDVIIRAFRAVEIDFQELVHKDMKKNFAKYPHHWGLTRPDTNIDHRRVPNLMVFFSRMGKSLTITKNPGNYLPGDIITWDTGNGRTHIGLVTAEIDTRSSRRLIVHNVGNGVKLEDALFWWKIIGHYRYFKYLN
jgi:uncharacterized protein